MTNKTKNILSKPQLQCQKGFTFIELILYITISTIVISAMVPFAWNIIGNRSKSSAQQDVFSQGRYLSERIKYEIRNSFGINSFSSTQIVLCQNSSSCATNPTTISYIAGSPGKVIIQRNGAAAVDMNSNKVNISSFSFTDNRSAGNTSENISFLFTVDDLGTSSRKEYQVPAVTFRGSAEVRSN